MVAADGVPAKEIETAEAGAVEQPSAEASEATDSAVDVKLEKEVQEDEASGEGEEGEGEVKRETVASSEYIISLMGYAIGIGNVWRFPYLVGRWGGGTFLVAYLLCMVLVASPMYFLELHWGQFTRQNTFGCLRMMHPRWTGVGFAAGLMLMFVLSYYNMLLAYCLVYLFNSFKDPLPWAEPDTPVSNLTHTLTLGQRNGASASEDFFRNNVLNRFPTLSDIDSAGGVEWHLAVTLLIVWVIVFLALMKGLKSSAKVSYVTVGLPILLMIVMIIRSAMLEGAKDGVEFYIAKFELSKFGEVDMWADACSQILFSLSPGMGTAITISSYTRKNEDVYFVNLLVTTCNSIFSLSGGFAVFSILGFISHRSCTTEGLTCRSVEDLASSSGAALAFVTLAEGVSQFGSGSNVFSVLFFIMLLTLGLDSTFAWVETYNTYIVDYCRARGRSPPQWAVAAATATFFFLIGLPFCTRIGFELLDTLDHYVTGNILIVVCFLEVMILRLEWDWSLVTGAIKAATYGSPGYPEGRTVPRFWYVALYYTAPPLLFAVFWFRVVTDMTSRYSDYPDAFQATGWVCLGVCMFLIPLKFFLNRNEERMPRPELDEHPQDPAIKEGLKDPAPHEPIAEEV